MLLLLLQTSAASRMFNIGRCCRVRQIHNRCFLQNQVQFPLVSETYYKQCMKFVQARFLSPSFSSYSSLVSSSSSLPVLYVFTIIYFLSSSISSLSHPLLPVSLSSMIVVPYIYVHSFFFFCVCLSLPPLLFLSSFVLQC